MYNDGTGSSTARIYQYNLTWSEVKGVSKPTAPSTPLPGATISQCKAVCEIDSKDSVAGCRRVYWDNVEGTCYLCSDASNATADSMTFRPKTFANAVWLFVNRSKVTPQHATDRCHTTCSIHVRQ